MTASDCLTGRRSIRRFTEQTVDHSLLSSDRGDGWQMFDAGAASLAFCLAAHAQGLGTVIMGIFDRLKATDLLELSEGRELVALIAAGYTDEAPSVPARKTASELLSFKS